MSVKFIFLKKFQKFLNMPSLHRRIKNNSKPVILQILDLIPNHLLTRWVRTHQPDKCCHKYKTYYQLVVLMFEQLGKCYTLSDISCGLSISTTFLSDLGLAQSSSKSTMSDGNKNVIIKSSRAFIIAY